jgi:hypothetical protein
MNPGRSGAALKYTEGLIKSLRIVTVASQNITQLAKDIAAMTGDSLLLCAARRQSFASMIELRKATLGVLWEPLVASCKNEMSSEEALSHLLLVPELKDKVLKMGLIGNTFAANYVVMRHFTKKAPVFAVSPALTQLLADTGVKDNVPVRYFAAPAATCYIEFEPPEGRLASSFKTYAEGKFRTCEGCYVQETKLDRLLEVSKTAREALELDPHAPVRIVNVSFTASPVESGGASESVTGYFADDRVDYFNLFIQDENESLSSLVDRHVRFYAMRNADEQQLSDSEFSSFNENFHRNLMHLSKILFYLNVDKRQQVTIKDATDLEKRINSVAEKKQRKLIQQLNRVYDRIVVGPSHYTPITRRMESGDLPKGTRKPHYRRGYFGIRHVGTGQAKHTELVRVKEALINEQLLKDAELHTKDYEIR